MAISSAEKSYVSNLKKNKETFNALLGRISGRVDIITRYNLETRKLLFAQELNYDLEPITIPDILGGVRTVQFSHALLIVFFILLHGKSI